MIEQASGVVVVGSANMDLVVRTPRFPQPGETILGNDFGQFPGGKGANQACAIGKLGGVPRMIGAVGRDAYGTHLLNSLGLAGVDTGDILIRTDCATGIALITVDREGENTIIVASGANASLTPDDVLSALPIGRVLLAQLETPLETVVAAVKTAKSRGMLTILNPAPAQPLPKELLENLDIITPNQNEATMLSGISADTEDCCRDAAHAILDQGVKQVVLTLGRRGCLYTDGKTELRIASIRVDTVDSTAAGDAFNGALAHFLGLGRPIEEALALACRAGALCTTRRGAQDSLPTYQELAAVSGGLL